MIAVEMTGEELLQASAETAKINPKFIASKAEFETRFVGVLGEMAVSRYSTEIGARHIWDRGKQKTHDFRFFKGDERLTVEVKVEVKTRTSNFGKPAFDWSQFVPKEALDHTLAQYFMLCCYDTFTRTVWIVGAYSTKTIPLYPHAGQGYKAHAHQQIQTKSAGDTYDVPYAKRIDAEVWFREYAPEVVEPVDAGWEKVERIPTHEEHCAGCYDVGDGVKIHPPRDGGPKWDDKEQDK